MQNMVNLIQWKILEANIKGAISLSQGKTIGLTSPAKILKKKFQC